MDALIPYVVFTCISGVGTRSVQPSERGFRYNFQAGFEIAWVKVLRQKSGNGR